MKIFGIRFVKPSFDRRHWRWFWQRRKLGFDERELWYLDCTIIDFVLPRLKVFRKNLYSYPSDITYEEWLKNLDKMIQAFEIHDRREGVPFCWPDPMDDKQFQENEDHKRYNEGFDLFMKYFHSLWT